MNDLCDDASLYVKRELNYTDYYEGHDKPQITTAYSVQFDERYNMVLYQEQGDTAISGDEWEQYISYLPNTARNRISLPKVEQVYALGGAHLRESRVNYNTKGHPYQIILRQDNSTELRTTLWYDSFGNVSTIARPWDGSSGRPFTTYQYDSVLHALPTRIENEHHMVSRSWYDLQWGVPWLTQDPAGNYMRYRYDYKGRLLTVTTPLELQNNVFCSLRYDYLDLYHSLATWCNTSYPFTMVRKRTYDFEAPTDEYTLYDARGTLLQRKSRKTAYDSLAWVIDDNKRIDMFGRVRGIAYPVIAHLPVPSMSRGLPFGC